DATLAPDEGGGRVRGEMGVLDRAQRHQSVRYEGGCRACEAEKRRPLRLSLRPTGEKRENEPWRGEQADIGRPGMAGQASKVLVSAAERDGERQRDRDDVHEQRLAGGDGAFLRALQRSAEGRSAVAVAAIGARAAPVPS